MSSEHKSQARRMAEEDYLLALANKIVVDAENDYVLDLVAKHNQAIDTGNSDTAEKILDKILREKERLTTSPDTYDEEEVVVYKLVSRKNGKNRNQRQR